MFLSPEMFHIAAPGSVSAVHGGLRIQAEIIGFAVFGPYVSIEAGIYRFRLKIACNEQVPSKSIARYDIFANHVVVCEGELAENSDVIVYIPDTNSLEFRIMKVEEEFLFQGIDVENIVLNREVINTQLSVDIANGLVEAGAQAEAIFAMRDRIIASHDSRGADAIERAFISRAQEKRVVQLPEHDTNNERDPDSDLKMVDLYDLDEEGRRAIAAVGCDLAFINATRLHRNSNLSPRSWQKLPGQLLHNEKLRAPLDMCQAEIDLAFQEDIALGNGIEAFCPWTGNLLRSHHGFIEHVHIPFTFYRFEGREVFYLCVGGNLAAKLLIFIPKSRVIINFQSPILRWYDMREVTRSFARKIAVYASEVSAYLSKPTRIAAIYGHNNMGHFCWNDLAGLQYMHEKGLLARVEETVELKRQFFPVKELFPQLEQKPSAFFNDAEEAFRHAMTRGLLPVRFTDGRISTTLGDGINATAGRLTSIDNNIPKDMPRPLLWVNLRAHNKIWLHQEVNYTRIFNELIKEYGSLSVFFDGMPDCNALAIEIQRNTDKRVVFHNGLGLPLIRSLNWANEIDAYICPIGSGLVLVNWLANKPGVAHAEHGHMSQMEWWDSVREDCIPPLIPELSEIKDVGQGAYCNYEMDWKVVLSLIRRILDPQFHRTSESVSFGT